MPEKIVSMAAIMGKSRGLGSGKGAKWNMREGRIL